MLKLRMVLLITAALYLVTSLAVTAQSLDNRITIVEQQLKNRIDMFIEPTLRQLYELEDRVITRDLQYTARLATIEESLKNLIQLVWAVGLAVVSQITAAIISAVKAKARIK